MRKEIERTKLEIADFSEKLQIIKENKLRHEDKLGVHLDIPDERKKKRKRRTAGEIER